MLLLKPSEYQAEIAARFEDVRAVISTWVPEGRVEHIGSSAIPGAVSKGDLDICLIVPLSAHAGIVSRLITQGYQEQQDTLRTPELCMLNSPASAAEHAIQLVAAGSEFEGFVQFRDALLANPALVEEYNAVKSQSSHLGADGYRAAKSAFIATVLASINAKT
ncbi:GrpB family protein [Roseateles sp. BYS180W]|uniref:GrpB family protein n=1 Tax=Roseateles rivi TaxID=3299028 RepID=A0ABW7FR65_9BURK